ncbi:MAG: hypothetical protein LQ337_007542 [Flavoplaca oasis]|nr:MAG: hypothetical protein LQ337_007542 [Flavoplaca oasis]
MSTHNVFILASDNSPQLLPLLHSKPSLALSQDEHGYSLVHAAASYGHHELLRTLIRDFQVDVNVKDEDGETPLFAVETVETAKILVEELDCYTSLKNDEGLNAEEKIRTEGDFVTVADYLRTVSARAANGSSPNNESDAQRQREEEPLPPLPPNVTVNMGTTTEDEVPEDVDPAFRARIEELASREDFQGEEGQKQLRELVTDAVRRVEGRDVRRRVG